MMLNHCEFIGNLGRDPEARTTQNGTKIVSLNLAVTETWKKDGQRQEHTEWIRASVFGPLADVCERYLKKGSKVYLAGKWRTRKWQDKSGQDRYSTELNVSEMVMLDSRGEGKPAVSAGGGGGSSYTPPPDLDDEIPFALAAPVAGVDGPRAGVWW